MAFFRRLGKLEVQVAADTSGFTSGMRAVSGALDVTRGSIRRFTAMASGVGGAIAGIARKVGLLSAALAGGGFTVMTVRAFKATGALSRLSRQLGVTVADLARAKHATILAGEGAKLFDSRVQRLSSQLRNAGEKAGIFKTQIQAWVAEVAKGGAEASKFGLLVDDTYARMVERTNVAMQRVRQAFVGRFRQIAVAIAPFIEFAANALTDFLNSGTTGARLVDKGMNAVRNTLAGMIGLLEKGKRLWLEFKVEGLGAALGVAEAIDNLGSMVQEFMGLGPKATGAGKAWSTYEPKTNRLQAMKARGLAEEVRKSQRFAGLNKALRDAVNELADLGDKPEWADRFTGWWDKLIAEARERMNEFVATQKPPKLADIKLPRLMRPELAPNIALGSGAALQASFKAQNQQGGMGQSLRVLVTETQKQASKDDRRNVLLDKVLNALEHSPVISMGG